VTEEEENQGPDEVGYGKPPKHTRFKKGHSGNPKGRTKGSKGFVSIVRHELETLVEVRLNGRLMKLSKRELMIAQLVNKAAAGDQRATDLLLELELLQREWREPGRSGEIDPEALQWARERVRGLLN
jgi:hypothetical protein